MGRYTIFQLIPVKHTILLHTSLDVRSLTDTRTPHGAGRLYPDIEDTATPVDILINGKWRLVYSSTFAGQTGGTQVVMLRAAGWMLRAKTWMLRATMLTLRAILWNG